MPRVTVTQQNFTAGEISPKMYGRSDIARYMSGAKEITNGVVLQHGGIKRRDGTVYVAEAGSDDAVLVKYIYTSTQSYCLEFGPLYIRFFTESGMVTNDSGVQYQITTQYTADQLDDLRFTQYGNYLFIAHPSHPIRQVERLSHNSWSIGDFRFINNPVHDDVWRPKYPLVLSSAATGTGRTATCPIFRTCDYRRDAKGINVSRKIYSIGGGEAIVTGNNATTSAGTPHTVEIIKPFEATLIEPGNWWIEGQPQVSLTISGTLSAGSSMTLSYGTLGGDVAFTVNAADPETYYNQTAWRVTATNTGGVALPVDGDILKVTKTNSEIVYYTVFTASGSTAVGGTVVFYVLPGSEDLPAQIIGAQKLYRCNVATNLATADDVGSVISINGGYVKITGVTSSQYLGEVVRTLNSAVSPIPNAWAIMRPSWNSVNGYPTAIATYEQRLIAGGTITNPNGIWFSSTGNFYDFLPGTLDDEAMVVFIAGDERAEVSHLVSGRVLTALCSSGEYTMEGGVEKPVAPTNLQIKNQSSYGCNRVRPIRIGSDLCFVQRAGKKIRSFRYNQDIEVSSSPDITLMSEHLTRPGIKTMAYAAEPESIVWIVLEDGSCVSATIEKDNDVIAFAPHDFGGDVLSACSVPATDYDMVWMIVRRDGGTYIERMVDGVYVDCGKQLTASPATDTWSGLSHLEGKEVSVVADGAYLGEYTVSGGSITISRTASSVTVGLGYTTTIETLMQDFSSGTGSIHGNSNRIGEVSIRYMDTVGCKINGDYVAFRRFDDALLDDAVDTFTGIHRMEILGWSRGDVNVTISQEDPLPFHIQQVTYKFSSND